jgi:hypothetical protein
VGVKLLGRGQLLDHDANDQVSVKREDLTRKSWSQECEGLFRYLRGEPLCPGHLTTIESRILKLGLPA